MDIISFKSSVINWMSAHITELIVTILVIAVYILLDRFSTPKLEKSADQSHLKEGGATKVIRIARLVTGLVGILIIILIWGMKFNSVLIFATTGITLLGVAFFASWSLLSNITAHIVLLLQPSFQRGTFIRLIDADNYTEGYISEMNLFNTTLVTENNELVVYPNNLFISRQVLVNPINRLNVAGKLPQHTKTETDKLNN